MNLLKNKSILSFGITSLLFALIYIIFNFRFENMDDLLISRLLYAGYTSAFSFQWISYLCNFISNFCDFSSWGIFLLSCTFIASWKLIKMFLDTENKTQKTFQFLAIVFILVDLLFQCQFTKVSAYLFIVGYISILSFLKHKKTSDLILGILFLFIGVSIRFKTLYVFLPFATIHALFISGNKKNIIKTIITITLISITCFGIQYVDRNTYSQEMKNYLEYNTARVSILDYLRHDFENIEDLKPEISENDFYMINNWLLQDDDYFSISKLEEIKETFIQNSDLSILQIASKLFTNTFRILFYPLGIIFVAMLIFSKNKKNWLYLISLMSLVGIFSLINRMPYRIDFSVITMGVLFLLSQKQDIKNITRFHKIIITILLILATLIHFITPIISLTSELPKEVNKIEEIINNDANNLYFYTFGIQFREYLNYTIFDTNINKVPKNKLSSSWDLKHPYLLNKLKQANIENQITEIPRKNIKIVEFKGANDTVIISNYLKEHYKRKTRESTEQDFKYFKITTLK